MTDAVMNNRTQTTSERYQSTYESASPKQPEKVEYIFPGSDGFPALKNF